MRSPSLGRLGPALLMMASAALTTGARGCEDDPPNDPGEDAGTPPPMVVDAGLGEPSACAVGGCSGQLCTDDPEAGSTCEWRDEYACYRDATCERQADGQCGWTETDELQACLDGGGPTEPPSACFVGGCSGQLCTDEQGADSTCEWREEYACYRDATCERQASGECGWTETDALNECIDNAGTEPEPEPCYVGGCSGQLCSSEQGIGSTCEWREEYACYRDATCERQASGECGWTETDELRSCIDTAS